MRTSRKTLLWSVLALAVAALVVAGCGKKSSKAASLDISVAESGKTAKYTVPSSTKGGLVKITLTNHGKAPHGGQLVRIEGNHTAQQVLKIIANPNNEKTPEWIRGEGGPGNANPGGSATATVNLPAGKYLIGDFNGPGGKPGYAQFTVTGGKTGKLPSTSSTITAANPGKDKYKWEVSGTLKSGTENLTFDSKGKEAIHLIAAVPVKGKPSKQAILKAIQSNGKQPSFVLGPPTTSSVLDGGKSEVTSFAFQKPGNYVLFCPLPDRDGGKPHFKEGLLTTVTVK